MNLLSSISTDHLQRDVNEIIEIVRQAKIQVNDALSNVFFTKIGDEDIDYFPPDRPYLILQEPWDNAPCMAECPGTTCFDGLFKIERGGVRKVLG